MSLHTSHDTAFTDLQAGFAGTLVSPGDPPYDEMRAVFNGMVDRRPSLIALCHNQEDVVKTVRFARDLDLELAVRGGGHSVAGSSTTEGGVVVDLRRMNSAVVDPDARTVRIGGGATMADLDQATSPYGLATTGGRVSTTGVGGFTLGGGSGWLERAFGLACDNLLAVDIVTADGSVLHTSGHTHPELFWALHGGGSNFGVATSLTLRIHPLPALTAALLMWPPDAGPDITRAYRDFMTSAPDEVGGGLIFLTAPEQEFVPEHLVGRLTCGVLITYTGTEAEAREAAAPMLGLGHHGGMVMELPYAALQSMFDDPPGYRNYWSAEHLESFPDQAVDVFCTRAHDMITPSPSQHAVFPHGGAVARLAADYPLPWRQAPWVVHPFGVWANPADDERGKRWARSTRADLQPWSSGAVYLNFIGQEGQDRVIAGYGPQNYRRLAAVKTHYDPDNAFRLNHNITPG